MYPSNLGIESTPPSTIPYCINTALLYQHSIQHSIQPNTPKLVHLKQKCTEKWLAWGIKGPGRLRYPNAGLWAWYKGSTQIPCTLHVKPYCTPPPHTKMVHPPKTAENSTKPALWSTKVKGAFSVLGTWIQARVHLLMCVNAEPWDCTMTHRECQAKLLGWVN